MMNTVPPHPHNNSHVMVDNNNVQPSGQKCSATMDSQYMQQQSQIFVFNTKMANEAADAVDSGRAHSIIEFHCSNPETKRLLDKYPIKPPMSRTSSAIWLNNLAQLKQSGRGIRGNGPGMHPSFNKNSFGPPPRGALPVPCVGPCNIQHQSGPGPRGGAPNNWPNNGNMSPGPNNWSAQPMFAQNSEMNSNQKFTASPMSANCPNGPNARGCAPFAPNSFQNNQMFNNSCNPGIGVPPQSGETPDENLTPQQREHREKQLAIIRKMQQQFCPEMMDSSPMGQMPRMPAPNQMMNSSDYMMDPNMCLNMCPENEHLANSDQQMMSNNPNNQFSQMPPTSGTAPLEWQKGNYMDERRRKSQTGGQGVHNNSVPISHQSSHSQPSSAINSPNPCISQSPGRIPPPPYNQGIRSHSSPHPSSPATGSLPLPSPRMQSPADSSRQQFTPGGQSRLSHTSPGPATPSADSNSSISGTGVHSPKALAPSSQNSIPSVTSSNVQNNCRTQTSTNVTTIRATTPSNIAQSPSPSNMKKVPNLMTETSKGMSQETGELLMNSGLDSNQKLHPNDMSLLEPTLQNNCRTQTSTNVTPMSASTPSSIAQSPSPSNMKKVSNLMTESPKGMSQESGELLMNSGLDSNQKLHPNDMSLLEPTLQNSCRTQSSTNVTAMSASTPSSIAQSPSPSNMKKVSNLMTESPKGIKQETGELLMNSGLDSNQKLHPNDMSLLGPILQNNCSSPFHCKPEPALMPVPSPQQIQYLNAFEGQELTIQKQPNTSLRDADLISLAPDLHLGFGNDFVNSCQPFPGNERLPNFPSMDPRFSSNPQNPNMNGHPFDMNPRFMNPDNNNQRFVGPVFDGPTSRMSNPETQFRPQNMFNMPYGQMDNNMMRFNPPCDNMMGPRIRGPTDMVNRFPQHPNDIQSPQHFNSQTMSSMSSEQMNLMPFGANQSSGVGCGMSSVNNFNPQMESGISSTHLQNLQKMTPPFEIGPPNKMEQMMVPNGSLAHSHNTNNQTIHGSNGPMAPVSQSQRTTNFDPISSMAAMGDTSASNMMSGPSMNMTSMQVAANGPPPGTPNMVSFHTSMASMQGIHQNMNAEGNGMNGMQGQFGMGGQMNPNMTGGPQTVNNTYVNATMSIQQLNIQTPNFNPNLDQNLNNQNMNIGTQSMPGNGPGMSPPASAMQMMQTNSSAKLGNNFGHRMSGPTTGPNFPDQQMTNNMRGMSQMNYPPNPHMIQRCSVYNSPNIQIKPDAPNTIQYLPPRQQTPNMSARAPSLDFLQRCEPPLTNLGNKLPTHNLQYFPNNSTNINSNQTMPLGSRMIGQNVPMNAGPGRPMNPSMVRQSNPNSGQQSMMPSVDMFGRPPAPMNMMHMGSNPGNPMFANMKQSGSGPMSPGGLAPDTAQPLPPSVGHSYNYKQSPFTQMATDPNYPKQYNQFLQQVYATNTTSGANSSGTGSAANPRMPSNNFYNPSK